MLHVMSKEMGISYFGAANKALFHNDKLPKGQKKLNKPLTHVGLWTVFFDPSPNWPQSLLPNM